MIGPENRELRILVIVAVLAGVGLGVYLLWPSGDGTLHDAATEVQATMLEAKQRAENAGGPAAARELFMRGLAAEQQADQLQTNGKHEAAIRAFRRATRHYRRARAVADSVSSLTQSPDPPTEEQPSVSQKDLTAIQMEADSLRERMAQVQAAADEVEAEELASEIYEEAHATAESGRRAYQRGEYQGYATARDNFDRALQLFRDAKQVARNRHTAETRRQTVKQLRQQLPDRPPSEVSHLLQRAESLRTVAYEAYEQDDFARAGTLLEETGMAYTQIQAAIDSIQDARSRAAARAENRSAAEEARRTMQEIKSELSESWYQQPTYERARALEREGQHLYDREQYAAAAKRFRSAEERYREIRETRIPLNQAREIIQKLVERYQQALEHKDIYRLQELVPGVDTRWWSDFFETAQNLVVSVDAGTIKRTRNGANVSVRVRIDYMDEKNRMEYETFRNVWTLRPDDGDWMISSASIR